MLKCRFGLKVSSQGALLNPKPSLSLNLKKEMNRSCSSLLAVNPLNRQFQPNPSPQPQPAPPPPTMAQLGVGKFSLHTKIKSNRKTLAHPASNFQSPGPPPQPSPVPKHKRNPKTQISPRPALRTRQSQNVSVKTYWHPNP